jgi:hypothetical protein
MTWKFVLALLRSARLANGAAQPTAASIVSKCGCSTL